MLDVVDLRGPDPAGDCPMRTITLEMPDELADQLAAIQDRVPELLALSLRQPALCGLRYHTSGTLTRTRGWRLCREGRHVKPVPTVATRCPPAESESRPPAHREQHQARRPLLRTWRGFLPRVGGTHDRVLRHHGRIPRVDPWEPQMLTTICSSSTVTGYVCARTRGSTSAWPVSMSNSQPCHAQRRIRPSRPYTYVKPSTGNAVPHRGPAHSAPPLWGQRLRTAKKCPSTLKMPILRPAMLTMRRSPGARSVTRQTTNRFMARLPGPQRRYERERDGPATRSRRGLRAGRP